jgi:hypothetical protein
LATHLGTLTGTTTIQLFNGETSLGSLLYSSMPDPAGQGGFAGIRSTTPFDRAELTFGTIFGPVGFGVDNIRFTPVAETVPEPSSIVLQSLGLGVVAYLRSQRRRAA